jgi:LCP family protein required for cell wall assembly
MYDDTTDPMRPRRGSRHAAPSRHSASGRRSAASRRTPRDISQLGPASTSRETVHQAKRRRSQGDKIVNPAGRRRRRKAIALTVLGVVVVGLLVGAFALWSYARSIQAKINPVVTDPALAQQLVNETPPPGDPFYMLLMGDDRRPGETQARSDTLIVARVDPKLRKVQMISIMRDTRAAIPGHGIDKINAAPQIGGPELALKTVRQLTGLPITKYLTVDFSGFQYIVDAMGGVWIDVPQKIDGIPSGTARTPWELKWRVIQPGYQRLRGVQALTFVRARHQFADQDFTRVKNQQMFLKALVKQGLQLSNVFKAPQIINAVADHIRTNMSLEELANLAAQMKGMKDSDLEGVTAPGTAKYMNGISYVVLDDAKFSALLDRLRKGEPLAPVTAKAGTKSAGASAATSTVAPSDVTLTIRNGAGVSGLVKTAAAYFTKLGFRVVDSGNANQFVYGTTLVVFKTASEAKAAPVADALGFGNVIPASGMYSFNSDILVVIGKDWRDPSAKTTRQ